MSNLTNQRQVFVEEYVRSGDHLDAAKKIYQISKTQSDFKTWPYKDILNRRIANAKNNVNQFSRKILNSENFNENTIMINTPFSCMACHEKG